MIRYRYSFGLTVGLSLLLLSCSGGRETTTVSTAPVVGVKITKARQLLLEEAQHWLGVPYAYGGTTRNGVDCSGLIFNIYGKFGVILPRTSKEMFGEGRAVNRNTILPGDLVFFTNNAGKGITHVGMYVGGEEFIHSSTQKGVIRSSLQDVYYRKYYAGARKIIK